jgi:ABC-type glycerol-3-phosphate transport system permease component
MAYGSCGRRGSADPSRSGGTYLPLIVPAFGGSAFFIFLIRQYMRTIPRDLDDAARVDGSEEKFTVAIGLANLVTRSGTLWNLTMAANLLSMIHR